MSIRQRDIMRAALAVFIFVANTSGFCGIPEPGITMYGSVKNGQGVLITQGNLVWTYQLGGRAITVETSLRNIDGQYSYIAQIPVETAISGSPLSANALEMPTNNATYTRTAKINGNEAQIVSPSSGTLVLTPAQHRGQIERVDLVVDFPEVLGRYIGDFNNDGVVDIQDFLWLLDSWGQVINNKTVGLEDFLALLDNYGKQPGARSAKIDNRINDKGIVDRKNTSATIRLEPIQQPIELHQPFPLQISIDSAGNPIRGGAVTLLFDPEVLEVANGIEGIVQSSGSPFQLLPPPNVNQGRIEIPFLEPGFQSVSYSGPIVTIAIRGKTAKATTITFEASASRFSPNISNTTLESGDYIIGVPVSVLPWMLY